MILEKKKEFAHMTDTSRRQKRGLWYWILSQKIS